MGERLIPFTVIVAGRVAMRVFIGASALWDLKRGGGFMKSAASFDVAACSDRYFWSKTVQSSPESSADTLDSALEFREAVSDASEAS
jgi:hypothetical protein